MSYKSKATQNCHTKGKQHRQQIMHAETSTLNLIDEGRLPNTHLQELIGFYILNYISI